MNHQRNGLAPYLAFGALLLSCFTSRADNGDKDLPPIKDRDFAAQAITAGKIQVRLSELALKQTSDDKVKDFAQKVAKEQGQRVDKLTDASRDLMVGLDYDQDKAAKTTYDRLAKLKGAEFDREYVKQIGDEYEKIITLFEREAKAGTIPAIKAVAVDGLKDLMDHRKEARAIGESIKDKKE